MDYQRLLTRLLNKPHLVTPERARLLLGALAPRAGLNGWLFDSDVSSVEPVSLEVLASEWDGQRPDRKIYHVDNGIAVLPVTGTLVSKLGVLNPYSGMTGYDGLIIKLSEALSDDDVKGIALDIESPGGEVHSELFELADMIASAEKPIWAICSDYAYSAAYWLASQCDHVCLPSCGGVGSVGAVVLHADLTKAYEDMGIKVTVLRAGSRKMEMNPYEALPEEAAKEIKADLEALRTDFATAVASGRGLDVGAVLATEARTVSAKEAVEIGFADELLSPSQAFAKFVDHINSASGPAAGITAHNGGTMNQRITGKRGSQASLAKNQAEEDNEVEDKEDEEAETSSKKGAGAKDAVPDEEDSADDDDKKSSKSAEDERKRIAAIIGDEEAKGRERLAQHLAFNTSMGVADARAALAAAPKSSGGLSALMAGAGNPDIGADGGVETDETKVASAWGASLQRVTGS